MIQELMIINQAGIALFYHNFKTNEQVGDKQSLASYFDIICRFTKHSFKENLKSLELDNYIFFFYTHKSLFHLVLKCDNNSFDKDLLEDIANVIVETFLKKYKDLLADFNGEVSLFHSFSEVIEKIIYSKFKSINNAPIEIH